MNEQDPLAHICPVCRQSNLCQLAESTKDSGTTTDSSSCWCMSKPIINKEKTQPLNISSKRCLCQRCLQQAQAQQ